MTVDTFAEVRRLVPARDAAECYGFHPSRANFISCPFHCEKTASLKLFDNGTWHCFGCGKGGSSIDFTAELFSLTLLEAIKRLNTDFSLGLELDKPPDKATIAAAQHRQEINDTYRCFEQWRDEMIRRLNTCFRLAHLTMKAIETPADLDRLTDAQALAIREQPRFEWLADILTGGTMAQQMQIFRERGQVGQLCEKILSNTLMKSGAA